MRGRFRFPLAFVLATVLGLMVLAASATVLIVEWRLAQHLTRELINNRVVTVIDQIERGIKADLDPTIRLVNDLSDLLAEQKLDMENDATVRAWLLAALAGRPHLSTISITRVDLVNFRVSRDENGQVIFVKVDLSQNEAALQRMASMRQRAGTYWGELIYVPELGQPIINARRAVMKDGQLMGYVAVAVTAGQLSDLVSEIAQSGVETPFVLYGSDRVLAHARVRDIFPHLTAANPLPMIDGIGDDVLAHLDEGHSLATFTGAAKKGIDVRQIDVGKGAIVMTRQLKDYGDTPWTIGAWMPSSIVDQQMAPLKDGAMIGGAAVVISLLIALLVGRLMAWPIKAATHGAAQIATLDTAEVKPLPGSLIRELHEQSRAFNALLATIRAFETYVPKSLVRRLIRTGGTGWVTSRQRDLTIMFTDIAGFTRVAERLPAPRVAALLNRHFAMLDEYIEGEGGTVDKFMGDGLLAFWGAPERLKHRARRACRSALAIEEALRIENADRRSRGVPMIRVRIGIHCGPTVVGNIGAPSRLNYTVIGDTVNVAQRLETLGKDLPGERAATIIVSDAIVRDAGPGFVFERLGSVAVRGRARPVVAFSLLGRAEDFGAKGAAPVADDLDPAASIDIP